MPAMHFKKPRFTYSGSGTFTKNKEGIQEFKETEDTKYIYRNQLDKAFFQHDMAYGDFKDFSRKTASDKVFRDIAFSFDKNPKNDGYQRGIASMVYKIFDKKSTSLADKFVSVSGVTTLANKSAFNNEIKQNRELDEELHKPIIRKLKKKRKLYSSFKNNIWGDMQLIREFNKEFRFLLCAIDSGLVD